MCPPSVELLFNDLLAFKMWAIINAAMSFVLYTGLPFKAPHQADQPTQCDHLRLSLKRLSVSEKCKLINPPQKNHCRRTSSKKLPKIEAKMVQNKITEVTGFHRSFKVSLSLLNEECRSHFIAIR